MRKNGSEGHRLLHKVNRAGLSELTDTDKLHTFICDQHAIPTIPASESSQHLHASQGTQACTDQYWMQFQDPLNQHIWYKTVRKGKNGWCSYPVCSSKILPSFLLRQDIYNYWQRIKTQHWQMSMDTRKRSPRWVRHALIHPASPQRKRAGVSLSCFSFFFLIFQ